MNAVEKVRYYGGRYPLVDWNLVEVKGEDRERFFQGQLTNDIESLEIDHSHLTTRLNRTGQLEGFFYLAKKEDCLYFLIPSQITKEILEELEKFIIMDDVELRLLDSKIELFLGIEAWDLVDRNSFKISFYGERGIVYINPQNELDLPLINEEVMNELRLLHGTPKWGEDVQKGNLINESCLNQFAISYDKGCFLGQETAAKIENNRGAAKYPVLIKLDSGGHISLKLAREERVEGKRIQTERGEGVVSYFPFYKHEDFKNKAVELYDLAVDLFQKEEVDSAIEYLKRAIVLDPSYADAYESLGVIYGRQEKFEVGIELMDKLLEVDESSVMAHTNKSLFLMRLGKIEEAEEEKGLATVKSFAKFGEEAKAKKAAEELKRQKEEELFEREGMFTQVLEIDPEDTIANFGMGDISFHRKEYEKAIGFLEKVISIDEKYSMAYLILGKSLEGLGESQKAREVFLKGIEIASKRGDMMPANEMQSRLSKL